MEINSNNGLNNKIVCCVCVWCEAYSEDVKIIRLMISYHLSVVTDTWLVSTI